ncbi:MAG: TQO small subunit DoxD [Chloroflexota bacterium]
MVRGINNPAATPGNNQNDSNSSAIPGWVMLPLRLFLGVSFLAAGFDKLTDPTFLDPSARGYIGQQIAGMAPGTPLEGFLLNFALPNATMFGVLTMGGEILIGLAVLLGLFTRFSAAMGLLLNLTFFLSATWEVRPFYFGADLPYVFLWLTLMLAGPGPFALDILVKRWLTDGEIRAGKAQPALEGNAALTRRAFLGVGAAGLTAVAMAATGLGWSLLHARNAGAVAGPPTTTRPTTPPLLPTAIAPAESGTGAGEATSTPAPAEVQLTAAPTEQPTAAPTAVADGRLLIAGPGDVPMNNSLNFDLPTGEPAVLVHNDAGYSAYVAICTHEGCDVSYNAARNVLRCPCHGAQFDPSNNGEVLRGPARRPLSAVAITVDANGSVYLA